MEFGNWALTEDSSEAYRATYVLLVSAILLPVILFARRGCMTVALVLLLASIVHQVSRLHVDTSYWGHIAAGVGLCRASHYILHGDGGALVIRVQHASLGLIATLAMFSYVVFRLPLHTFYNKVHATIWALASLLFASMAAHPITARACNGALPRVAAARQLHDPAVLAALGTLLYTHLHDMQPIGMLFHQVFGVQLGAISVMMLASSAVHAALPRESPLCTLVRGLHAFWWLFAGVWAVHMAAFMYVFKGKRGVHHLWLGEDTDAMHAHEVGGWYLAVDAWLSAAVLVLPLLCCPAKSAELSSVAVADDDGDPLLERKSSVVHM
uniref:Uncharacterized protein n=1 Tax=Emiliania huxleyi TaxID=2903 RepID=A0A7S3T119_EMIHU